MSKRGWHGLAVGNIEQIYGSDVQGFCHKGGSVVVPDQCYVVTEVGAGVVVRCWRKYYDQSSEAEAAADSRRL